MKIQILATDATNIYAYISLPAPRGWHVNNPIHLSISKKGDSLYQVVSWKGLTQNLTNNITLKREAVFWNFILNFEL